jgi:hypothetical protein
MTPADIPAVNRERKKAFHSVRAPIIDRVAVQTRDPFLVLVGTILSARTKDACTAAACGRLFQTVKTPEDLRRIQTELAQLLHDGLAAELARGGYQLTGESGEDVLRVTPQITDLYVNAPDTRSAGIVRTYVMDAGRMTLVVEARDSTTGQLLARVVDTRRGTNTGQLQWANSVTNSAEARRAIDHWSRVLREGLDELHRR